MSNFAVKRNYQIFMLFIVFFTSKAYPTLSTMLFHEGRYGALSPAHGNFHTALKMETNHLLQQTVSNKNIEINQDVPKNIHGLNSNHPLTMTKSHRIVKRSKNSDLSNEPAASDFVFPGRPRNFVPRQDVKNCSQVGIDLCVSNVLDYPYSHIKRILKNATVHFKNYFTDDVIDVSTRFDEDDEMVCDAEETILYPKFGKTANDDMLFIINVDENLKQGVRVERCKKPDESPCNSKFVTPTGYKTYCKQKYAYRKLLALQPNGEPMPDNFKIPSCCSCAISQDLTSFRGLLKGRK